MTEQEKRLHRCCFSGHRPEKLNEPEAAAQWKHKSAALIDKMIFA